MKFALFAILFLLLSSASLAEAQSVSKGEVRGILVDKKSQAFPDGQADVILGTIFDEDDNKVGVNIGIKSTNDSSGVFLLKDVPAGKHALILFIGKTGMMGIILKGEKPFIFEVPQNSGVDLGKIDASKIRTPSR